MPLEQRPSLGAHRRSTSSINNTNTNDASPSSTPPQHKAKGSKHVVGKHPHQIHSRVPSTKGLHQHKHGGGSHTDLKKAATSSTNLKKNSSHVSLRRNRSTADVQKSRPKSSHGVKRPTSVHFEIGSQGAGETEDGWEEASSSASPALSRSASRLGSQQSSAKPSANNSQHHSPNESPNQKNQPPPANVNGRSTADARIITERLLQRTPSYNTTKMSLTTAKPTPTSLTRTLGTDSLPSQYTPGSSSGGKDEVTSRFVNGGSSATPGEQSSFLHTAPHNHKSSSQNSPPKSNGDEVKRAQSMGNLTWHDSSNTENEESESALRPRSRKPHASTTQSYVPAQQSRTQQKLWLQRASSNIEPQQAGAGPTMPGYDGRTSGTRAQLEKTGLEYLVVRRYQDPIGAALKRLVLLPGNEKMRRIPAHAHATRNSVVLDDRSGLSQSLRDRRSGTQTPVSAVTRRSSFEGGGSQGSMRDGGEDTNEGVQAVLRSIWEKNFEMSGSA